MKNNEIIEKIAKSTIRGKLKYMLSILAMCGLISLVAFSRNFSGEGNNGSSGKRDKYSN